MARWLVDGMNVIGSRPDKWWNDPDRAVHRMVESLEVFAEATGDDVTVVFDRKPRDLEAGRRDELMVAFASRRGRNAADHDIAQLVEEDPDPSSIRVVTSDGPLAQRVRAAGAQVTSAGSFRRRLDELAPRDR